jgi:hypothetical protein
MLQSGISLGSHLRLKVLFLAHVVVSRILFLAAIEQIPSSMPAGEYLLDILVSISLVYPF